MPSNVENQEPWFTFDDLKADYPYSKIQNAVTAEITFVNNILIPEAMQFVQSYTGFTWTTPPDEIKRVAKNYTVNRILGDDENIRIAHMRRQQNLVVAGDTINLDLSLGQNPYLSEADQIVLDDWRNQSKEGIHVDKVRVKSQGSDYENATGRGKSSPPDFVRADSVPGYFTGH